MDAYKTDVEYHQGDTSFTPVPNTTVGMKIYIT